jgi:predicted ATP-grasp superfamily ATP-dependent carboligase
VWELAYSGPGCAQFLRDDAAGTAMFLEINPRFDSTIALPYQCGCDLPLLALQAASGKELVTPEYKEGKRIHWLVQDAWAAGRMVLGSKGGFRMRLSHVLRFWQSTYASDCDMTFEVADPLPAFHAGVDLLEAGVRRLGNALGHHPRAPRTRSPR